MGELGVGVIGVVLASEVWGSLMTILGDSGPPVPVREVCAGGGGVWGRVTPVANWATALALVSSLAPDARSVSFVCSRESGPGSGWSVLEGLGDTDLIDELELEDLGAASSSDCSSCSFLGPDSLSLSLTSFLSDFFDDDWFLFRESLFLKPFIILAKTRHGG